MKKKKTGCEKINLKSILACNRPGRFCWLGLVCGARCTREEEELLRGENRSTSRLERVRKRQTLSGYDPSLPLI